jgi:NAD(P)H-nitrite reductase large subunit
VWICFCKSVNSGTIVEAIASGALDLDAVGAACEAGTVCGRCQPNIEVLLEQHRPPLEVSR